MKMHVLAYILGLTFSSSLGLGRDPPGLSPPPACLQLAVQDSSTSAPAPDSTAKKTGNPLGWLVIAAGGYAIIDGMSPGRGQYECTQDGGRTECEWRRETNWGLVVGGLALSLIGHYIVNPPD